MVKSLSDVCLDFICRNIDKLGSVCSRCLTHQQKEIVIERLAIHDQFSSANRNAAFSYLFHRNLKDITLENCLQVDDNFLEVFATCQCRLDTLSVSYCKKVTDKGLSLLLGSQSNLKKLTLKYLQNVTGECFTSMVCSGLWFLNAKGCSAIEGASIDILVQRCNRISYLNLAACSKLNDNTFDSVAGFLLGNLEMLSCSYLPLITDQTLISLADRCLNLKLIKLHGCGKVSSAGLRAVFKACQLAVVDLSYCYNIVNEPDILSDCLPPTLTKVVLRGTQVDRRFLGALSMRCQHLQVIELCGIQTLEDQVVCELLEKIGSTISELDFSWCYKITDASIKSIIKHCPKVSKLTFVCCKGITGEPLKHYCEPGRHKQAEALTRLAVGGCPNFKTDVLLDVIPHCINLEDITVSGQKLFCDDYLFCLAKNCPNLKRIGIKACVQITDVGVCEVVRYCTGLESLVLSGLNHLTDKTVFFMASSIASTLKTLYISGCSKISYPSVRYLKDVCINFVYVEHKIPNAPPNQLMAKNLDTGEFCRADLMPPQYSLT